MPDYVTEPLLIEGESTAQPTADLTAIVWRGRWLILGAALLGFLAATLYMRLTDPQYVAEMLVMPAQTGSGSAMGSPGNRLSGVASLAGVNLDAPNPHFTALRSLVKSARVYEMVDREHQLRPKFFPKQWDAANRRWLPKFGFVAGLKSSVQRFFDLPVFEAPGPDDLARIMDRKLDIAEIEKTGVYRVTFTNKDPHLAKQVVDWTVATADRLVRDGSHERTNAQIANLETRLHTVSLAEHRTVLTELLASEERELMMITPGEPFAIEVLQAAHEPQRPSSPQVFIVWLIGILGGAGLALAYLILKN